MEIKYLVKQPLSEYGTVYGSDDFSTLLQHIEKILSIRIISPIQTGDFESSGRPLNGCLEVWVWAD